MTSSAPPPGGPNACFGGATVFDFFDSDAAAVGLVLSGAGILGGGLAATWMAGLIHSGGGPLVLFYGEAY